MAQPLKDTDAILTSVDDLRAKDAEIAALTESLTEWTELATAQRHEIAPLLGR